MKDTHSLLRRQLKKFFQDPETLPEAMADFVDTVNEAYHEFDTDREMLERALDLSSQELIHANAEMRAVFLALPDTLFTVDKDGLILTCKSSRTDDLFFSTETGMLGKRIQDVPSKEIGDMFREALRQARETHSVVNVGYALPMQGKESFYEARMVPFLEDQTIVIVRNITEQKQMEEEIARERSKLKTISDNAPFGMVLIDEKGNFTYMNPKFTQLFGFDPSELPDGRTWFRKAFPDAEYRQTVISTWMEDSKTAQPRISTAKVFSVTCKDGTQKTVNIITSMLVSGDHLMACEDITDLKHLESQLVQAQKMEAIGTLAGGIAHDFNNILTTIIGYASLLQMSIDRAGPLNSYVDPILSASQKAADLTRSLLAFSRRQPITVAPLDINNTIKGTENLLRRLLSEDIELSTSLTADGVVVMADKTQMDQILFNLVSNARDAMPNGGTLLIETDAAAISSDFIRSYGFGKAGRYMRIKVSDTGAGMDEVTREHIFDPFFTTKEVGKGTGLGLTTVYGIVKQHGGYITVDSKQGQGTVFQIYLPVVTATIDQETEETVSARRGEETILIAEDNEGVRRLMKDVLQKHGYRTIEATDGEDATDRFARHQDISLVILDSVMPKKNGREVYEEIQRVQPDMKVIFTSGYTKDIILDKGIEDKDFDFIAKPLSPATLLQKVREVLDRPPV